MSNNILNLGLIIGDNYTNFLSLDEYDEHFLLPFSPRFRVIDFAISSLYSAGIKNIWIFCRKSKEIIHNYTIKNWPNHNILVFDKLDYEENFEVLLNTYIIENQTEYIAIANGSIPNWFEMENIIELIKNNKNYIFYNRLQDKSIYNLIILKKDLLKLLANYLLIDDTNCETKFLNIKEKYNLIPIEIKGYVFSFDSLKEYYNIHLQMIDDYLLLDRFNKYVPIQKDLVSTNIARLGKDSYIKNSLIGDNTEIEGNIENSIIFNNVKIQKEAYIKNSLIFPGNHIGNKVIIINSIIDEFSEDNSLPNIEHNSRIGNENPVSFNVNYPNILNFGVTLIGKDNKIPPKTEIESNCYIASFTPYNKIKEIKRLKSGFSIIE